MQITDEKEFFEKLSRLLIHVGSELASILVIASLNDLELLEKNRKLLTTSIKDIKNLYDEKLLHLKKNGQNQELQRAMEFLDKLVTRLAKIVGNVVKKI